jgi:hypothetical protein
MDALFIKKMLYNSVSQILLFMEYFFPLEIQAESYETEGRP